jgi:hypothetical protein
MRKLLMLAGAAALAVSLPAEAKPGGGGGHGGGPKAEHGGGHGHGNGGDWKGPKEDRGGWKQAFKAERRYEKQQFKAERRWAKAEQKREKHWRRAEEKAARRWAGWEPQFRSARRDRTEGRRFDDRRQFEDRRRFADASDGGCPPGLAKKHNGCLPPGQAKQLRIGERIPAAYYPRYNLPDEYRGWYPDSADYSYRYDEGNIYRIDNGTNLVSALIPLLGGAFGVGNMLPAGFDAYNLPMQYRDDYQDGADAYYRYGDGAIYQVDPKTKMIESVVALLAGDLNVGQLLPAGYDTYNLPLDYRDRYQDSDEAMYRYADGNIYEVDPKSRIIEAIVAQLT